MNLMYKTSPFLFVLIVSVGCSSGATDGSGAGVGQSASGGAAGADCSDNNLNNTFNPNCGNQATAGGTAAGTGSGMDGFDGANATDGTGPTGATAGTATDGEDGNSGSTPTPEPPPFDGIVGFPSTDLYLQIVGPSSKDFTATGGGITYIAGIIFDNAEKIYWQSSTGQSGEADGGGGFWKTGPVTLAPGDNVITVKAVNGSRESEDTITVTYNPGFFFAKEPTVRPSSLMTGQSTKVAVTLPIPTKNIVPSSVTLWEVDKDGNNIGQIGPMMDDGLTSSETCDEIQDDGVYSRCLEMNSAVPTKRWLRVSLQVSVEGAVVQVYSPLTVINIIQPVTVSECQSMNQVLKDAKALYASERAAGNASPQQAVVDLFKSNPLVADAGTNKEGSGVWVQYQSGVLGALNLPVPGYRGGGAGDSGDSNYGTQTGALVGNAVPIESKNVLALAPFNQTFGTLDEVPQISQQLSSQQCPKFAVDGPHLNGAATLSRLRDAYKYGILLMSTHGDTYFDTLSTETKRAFSWEHDGAQEIVWSGEAVNCNNLTQTMATCETDSDCGVNGECVITEASGFGGPSGVCLDHTQIDMRLGRIIMGADTWGIHPVYFPSHAKRQWPATLVYLGGCRTLFNGTMAGELFGVGAKAISGFTNYVTSEFASNNSRTWFSDMLTNKQATGQAALFPVSDPANPSGMFALFGGSNVVITDADMLNGGFEKGDATSWNIEGDGRVIGQLGISIPVGGKFMGILSTGLGYTQQTGELNQSFCIPEGIQEISFYWKYFSEEFKEWCGTSYQDTFKATLESASGQFSLVDVKIDDLCPAEECSGCGGKYVGLVPSDVSFDQGGVYNTQWQKLTQNIAALAGAGPVTLRLFATDQGDSIYDTAILVDSIEFE